MTPEKRTDMLVGACTHVGVAPRAAVSGGHDYACAPCIAEAIRAATADVQRELSESDGIVGTFGREIERLQKIERTHKQMCPYVEAERDQYRDDYRELQTALGVDRDNVEEDHAIAMARARERASLPDVGEVARLVWSDVEQGRRIAELIAENKRLTSVAEDMVVDYGQLQIKIAEANEYIAHLESSKPEWMKLGADAAVPALRDEVEDLKAKLDIRAKIAESNRKRARLFLMQVYVLAGMHADPCDPEYAELFRRLRIAKPGHELQNLLAQVRDEVRRFREDWSGDNKRERRLQGQKYVEHLEVTLEMIGERLDTFDAVNREMPTKVDE